MPSIALAVSSIILEICGAPRRARPAASAVREVSNYHTSIFSGSTIVTIGVAYNDTWVVANRKTTYYVLNVLSIITRDPSA